MFILSLISTAVKVKVGMFTDTSYLVTAPMLFPRIYNEFSFVFIYSLNLEQFLGLSLSLVTLISWKCDKPAIYRLLFLWFLGE